MILEYVWAGICVVAAVAIGYWMCEAAADEHYPGVWILGVIGAALVVSAIQLVAKVTINPWGDWVDLWLPQHGQLIHDFTWLALMFCTYAGVTAAVLCGPWLFLHAVQRLFGGRAAVPFDASRNGPTLEGCATAKSSAGGSPL